MYKFSKYKEQYRENLKLALPVVLSQLGQVIVQLADNTMVGQYGGEDATPLAAAAFANAIFFIIFVVIMGMTFGITPLVGELFAQGKSSIPTKYFQNSIIFYLSLAVLGVVAQYAVIPFMGMMGQPAEVVQMAIPFYKLLIWSLVPIIIFFTVKQFLEGLGNTTVAMIAVIISNIVNIVLNYVFIWGHWGAPELGVVGAGVATIVARVVCATIIVLYFLRAERFRIYRERFSRYNFSMHTVRKLYKIGFPISIQIFFEASAFSVLSFAFGLFGTAAITANQIGFTMGNCTFMIVVAIGIATTIRVSHCYGLRDITQMKLASKAAWHLALVWNIVMGALYFAFRGQIPRLFSSNAEVVEMASILLVTIAAYQIPDGLQCISVGVLRGMQDVNIIPRITCLSYWVCNIPVAYICAFHLGMGPVGLYMGLLSGLCVAAVLLYLRIKRGQKRLQLY